MTGARPAATIPDLEARPIRALLWVAVVGAALLLYGLLEPGEVLDSTLARTVWIVVAAVSTLVLALPRLWWRLRIEDGVLTKRGFGTSRVDLRDLATIRTFKDRPWQTNPPGVIRFEDRRGGAVAVALMPGAWVPPTALWPAVAAAVDASGLPMSGIVGAQLERYVGRSLLVDEANRAALERARAEVRAGRVAAHETRGGGASTARLLRYAGMLVAVSVIVAAVGGAAPDHTTTLVLAALVVLLALVALDVWRRTDRLRLREDTELGTRAAGVRLAQLAAVDLVPDQAFLSTSVEGRQPPGRRIPTLRLRDTDDGTLDIHLGGRWLEPVPILRYVLAAAEERDVDLSEHARYELEFRVGLAGRLRFPTPPADQPGVPA